MTQYLYLIKCHNFYKIGVANDVKNRLAQLSTGNPFDLEVLAVYGYENSEPIEKALHQRFGNVRKRGEWFELSDEDISIFNHICGLLGGIDTSNEQPTDEEIEEAEDILEQHNDIKWNFAEMFLDGWRMEQQNGNNCWNWRKGSRQNRKTVYGGRISDLPYDIDTMRRVFRDGGEK